MGRRFRISFVTGLVLTSFIVACRRSGKLADFYSLRIYPVISGVLSWVSSPAHVSFQAIAICFIVAAFFIILLTARRRRRGWKKTLALEINLLVWTFVWFYMGWCLNYSRSSIFERTGSQKAQYDSTAFVAFLDDFTSYLDDSYVEDAEVPEDVLESEIKGFYGSVPASYGLCRPKSWQHPKRMMVRAYHSATGVVGFMGPLFSEFHINSDMLPSQVPFTWAHEYSHLLGVSSEAEANWWAWNACTASTVPAIRYSAYLSMLPYVMGNASRLMSQEDFRAWVATIRPEILRDQKERQQYWRDKRSPLLDKVQGTVYDLFLKGNNIPSGTKNYSEVIQMMLCIDYKG